MNSSNLDEGEGANPSMVADQLPTIHSLNNHLCQFLSIDIETGGIPLGLFSFNLLAEIMQTKLVSMGHGKDSGM